LEPIDLGLTMKIDATRLYSPNCRIRASTFVAGRGSAPLLCSVAPLATGRQCSRIRTAKQKRRWPCKPSPAIESHCPSRAAEIGYSSNGDSRKKAGAAARTLLCLLGTEFIEPETPAAENSDRFAKPKSGLLGRSRMLCHAFIRSLGPHRAKRLIDVTARLPPHEPTISRAAACRSAKCRPAKSSMVNAVLTQRMLIER
jgi:hypothetical protein